ncbi:TonB-dependent receptor [Pedobacter cryoconitis]|uniref:TonB-dependent receptor n=1 Tax=Pedobacter cryoconitis TaxID=188932 RepID=A0A127VES3_9SPHI|nr:outer membrane beta-barrel protein [Pedobacter cryoconitis]AMP99721.1 TonB-dependent receptor [Pedobacter cryoconitis]
MKFLQILLLALVCLFFLPNTLNAQTGSGKISGRVIDSKGNPLDGANVALSSKKDSSIAKLELTGINGKYNFEGINYGHYEIFVSYMGERQPYKTLILIDTQHIVIQLEDLVLNEKKIQLNEVNIVQKKSFVEQKIDRTVVNVDALISNAGTTALDVLEKSPGVRVDQNGSISLKGRAGVVIFIDDKPTYLSGSDLEGYLKSLPSSALDQIEIMTNPPAKYDATGNAGIINIKTKKQKISGFNIGVNLSLGQHKYTSTNNSLDFNYRNNKFNVFGNAGYMNRNGFADLTILRTYKNADGSINSNFDQLSNVRKTGYGFNSTLGADYYQSEKTTWGIVLGGLLRYPESNILNTSNFSNVNYVPDSVTIAKNRESSEFKNGSVNLNFRHQFKKKGPDLAVDLDYIAYRTNNDQSFNNKNYSSDGILKSDELLKGLLFSDIKIYSAKADYTHPLSESLKLAGGIKASYTKTDNIADYSSILKNITYVDYDKTNRFKYQENINSAYLNLNKDFRSLSIQMGLRLENTVSNGHQLGNIMKPDSSFKRSYTSLFPTLFLLYKLDSLENGQLRFNYGRRIDRPYYQDLNPFISPLDKFTYMVGNPYLLPSFSNKVELSYIYKKKITATVSYSDTKDQSSETIEIVDGIYYSRPGNISSTNVTSISLDAGFDPTKWLAFQFYSELAFVHSKSNFYTGLLETKGTNGYLQGLFSFKLPSDWNIQIDGHYQTKITSAQFVYGSKWGLNAGVSKKISPRASLKLSISDIFYTNINSGEINNLNLTNASYRNLGDSRRGLLTLSFRFGKVNSNQSRYEIKGAENEMNRVKQ